MLGRAALAVLALGVGAAVLYQKQAAGPRETTSFEELQSGLFRHTRGVDIVPLVLRVPVSVWLVRGSDPHSYVLVDTGVGTPDYVESFKTSMLATLTSAQAELKLILLTHSHGDHTGGLPWLLEMFPKVPVAFHEKDARYISGHGQYSEMAGETANWNLMKHMLAVNSSQPADRCFTFKGEEGDVSKALAGSIPGLSAWLPAGVLEYIYTPGHLLGHVSYLHKPTSSLIAGDVAFHTPPPFTLKTNNELADPLSGLNQNTTLLHETQRLLAQRTDIQNVFLTHDAMKGISFEQFKAWAMR